MNGRPKSISKRTSIRVAVAAETKRTLGIARTVGKRLRHQLNTNGGVVPGPDWLEAAKWLERTVAELGRLVEGEIGALEVGPLGALNDENRPLTDKEYAAEIRIIAVEHLREASPEELRQLLVDAGLEKLAYGVGGAVSSDTASGPRFS